MKSVKILFGAVLFGSLLLVGCGGAGLTVNTRDFEAAFSAAPADLKSSATQAASAIKKPDYEAAIQALQKVVATTTLSTEQQKATSQLLIEMQKAAYQNEQSISGQVVADISDLIGSVEGNAPINR